MDFATIAWNRAEKYLITLQHHIYSVQDSLSLSLSLSLKEHIFIYNK